MTTDSSTTYPEEITDAAWVHTAANGSAFVYFGNTLKGVVREHEGTIQTCVWFKEEGTGRFDAEALNKWHEVSDNRAAPSSINEGALNLGGFVNYWAQVVHSRKSPVRVHEIPVVAQLSGSDTFRVALLVEAEIKKLRSDIMSPEFGGNSVLRESMERRLIEMTDLGERLILSMDEMHKPPF